MKNPASLGCRANASSSCRDAPGWSAHDAALVRAADQLHIGCDIDDATWAVLAARYDAPSLVEIVYVVGQYTMLSMVANGLRVNVPQSFRPLPG